jgi:hypothetical protein
MWHKPDADDEPEKEVPASFAAKVMAENRAAEMAP